MDREAQLVEMNRLRDDLRHAHQQGIIDYKDLSTAIGMNETYVQQFVTKGSPRIRPVGRFSGDGNSPASCHYNTATLHSE